MQSTFQQIISDLKSNKYSPVYLLQGEEPFFIDYVVDFIEEHAIDEAQKAFNQIVIYGKDSSIADILNNAKRFPLMSERQVVIVKEAQELSDFGKDAGLKMMEQYLQNPVPSTILVIAYKYKKFDQRKSISKSFDKAGIVFTTPKLYDKDLNVWINFILENKKIKADDKAKFLIAENIGLDLSRVNNELEKIRLSIAEGEVLDEAKVLKLIGISREYNVWELQKALASGNRKKIFAILKYFESNPKAAPLSTIIASLYTFYSRILIIHQKNYNNTKSLQDNLGVNYFAAQDFLNGSKVYPLNKIPLILSSLRYADAQFKGVEANQMKESEVLKELILRILY